MLLPQLRQVVSASELNATAEDFEHQKVGQDGFQLYVERSQIGKATRCLRSIAIDADVIFADVIYAHAIDFHLRFRQRCFWRARHANSLPYYHSRVAWREWRACASAPPNHQTGIITAPHSLPTVPPSAQDRVSQSNACTSLARRVGKAVGGTSSASVCVFARRVGLLRGLVC
jgi:hypothetical protein